MAARTTTRTRGKGSDTRAVNFQPNNMPEHIVVVVFSDGEEVSPAAIPQNGKLSNKGNVTYLGGIKGGWEMEGNPTTTLNSLSFVIDGVELKPSSERAHSSGSGNPTIFHGGSIELKPFDKAEPVRYTVQVWTTYSLKQKAYTLDIKAFPAPTSTGPRGPQVIGSIGAGFVLRPRPVAPTAA